jgi:hypothetical protein
VLLGLDYEVHLLMFLLLSSYYILSRSLEDVGTEELGQSSSGLTYCIMIWVWSFGEWVGEWFFNLFRIRVLCIRVVTGGACGMWRFLETLWFCSLFSSG